LKKILFISTLQHIKYGGSELLWLKTAEYLLSRGIVVGVYAKSWRKKASHIAHLEDLDAQVFEFGDKSKLDRLYDFLLRRIVGYDRTERKLKKIIKSFNPDLVVINTVNNLDEFTLKLLKRISLSEKPYAVFIHLAHEFFWKIDSSIFAFREYYEKALKVFFVSNANLNLTQKQLATSLDNAAIVRNPVNCFGKLIPYPQVDKDNNYKIAVIARLLAIHKGQDLLFEVLKKEKWKKRKLYITLYGEGKNEQSLKELKKLYQLDNVNFGDYHSDIDALWSHYHALVLPSRMEGLSLAMIEAMLCGRTVICTDVGGAREVIQDNETGFIAEAATVKHLEEAMERAWTRRSEWEEMGLKARKYIKTIMPENPAEQFAEILLDLIK